MDAIAIKDAAKAIKGLVEQFTAGYRIPADVVEIINQITFQADSILNWYLVVDKQYETPPAPIDGARPLDRIDMLAKRVDKLEAEAPRAIVSRS